MAIRSVNGVNVYVLEPKEVTGKTTSGKNFATLYSDLRWQVWEEVQKTELAKLELERMSAKAKADIYEQSQRDIRRSITELQTLKAQVLTGGSTANQAARTQAKQAELDLRAAEKTAELRSKAATKVRTVTGRTDALGRPVASALVVTEEREGEPPVIRAPRIGEVPLSEEEKAAGVRRTAGLDFLDAEIKNFATLYSDLL
jgi:Skp family chaperone for outer membrane proteins